VVGHDVGVGVERHRRRVAGLAGDLDHGQAFGDQQRAERMAQVVRTHSGHADVGGERIEDTAAPVAPVVIAP
jgi:hypothetical protein